MKAKISIVLADDHRLVRQGLRALLQTQPDFIVVGEADDGLKALAVVTALKPDVLVLDLSLPSLDGVEVTRRVARDNPSTRVLILSMYEDDASVSRALRNGAAGYMLKGGSAADLSRAIREVALGRRSVMVRLSENVLDPADRGEGEPKPDAYEGLTPREREVLHMAAEGLNSGEIARRIGISARTVETHRANLMRKLGVHRRAGLVRYALWRGVLAPGDGGLPDRGRNEGDSNESD